MKIIGASAALPSSCASALRLKVEPIYDQYRIGSYIAKESTKEVPSGFTALGKFYGVFGPVTRIPTVDCLSDVGLPYLIRALRTLDRKRRQRRGWKRRRDSGRWSHSFSKWNNSEMKAINALIEWANGL